ncbi:hypothetical protein FQA39_LY06703 [Lamprigera yunnana]|nr:hypothetical protein FQA39_LY06703 [Lamprigera yunnana]
MDFGTRRKKQKLIEIDSLAEIYPLDLQFYNIPPMNEITLTEFEDLAFERLQVLRILEQATQKGNRIYSQTWFDVVRGDLRKHKLMKFLYFLELRDEPVMLQSRRADHISHFILRLAYCRSDTLRSWFLTREMEWFKARFLTISEFKPEFVKKFLTSNDLTYNCISAEEKQYILPNLLQSTTGVDDVSTMKFYKVPFTEVYNLVNNRKVFVKNGFAYIPNFELITCILTIFRAKLSEALAYATRIIPKLDDDRLNNLLQNIHTSYIGRDYATPKNSSTLNVEHLDYYAKKQFPLCMRNIHESFRSTHHMKYGSRMQYGLFLKAIGLSFDDCMKIWRDEFTKLIDESTFEKQYSYLVKHHHGKVGSMTNYRPYSCMTIIMGNVGSGEHHGCPFKHFDATNLKHKLSEYGIPKDGVDEILNLVKENHYQIACTKYFEYTQGKPSKTVINHPNQYFEESQELLLYDTKVSNKKFKEEIKVTNRFYLKVLKRFYSHVPNLNLPMINNKSLNKYITHLECEYRELKAKSFWLPEEEKRYANLQCTIDVLEQRSAVIEGINNLTNLLSDEDVEIQKLAKEEEVQFTKQLKEIDSVLLDTLLPIEEHDNYNSTVLEINTGVGGQEAMLFAKELFEMYLNFAQYKSWDFEVAEYLTTDLGGVRHASALVNGEKAFQHFKYEAGVHRVQRIPATEKSGRIHTSTVSVLALPQPTEIEIVIENKDLRIETKRASGAGGQHVNTTDSAVRITHIPTNISVECQVDRSQLRNKSIAMQRLRALLYERKLKAQMDTIGNIKKNQVRTNFRNEKIRTYNFSQDRITDHRISGNIHNIKVFFEGGFPLENLINKLHHNARIEHLLNIVTELENK